MAEWHIFAAHFEELALERELRSLRAQGGMPKIAEAIRLALVWIDEHAVAGNLEAERNLLRAEVGDDPFEGIRTLIDRMRRDGMEPISRLTAGLRHPDPEIRGEFEDLARKWGYYDDPPIMPIARKAAAILIRPETPPKKRGRRKLDPPWRDKAVEMDKMRFLVSQGSTAREAAVEVSRKLFGERARYLAKLYEMKASLRK